MKKKPARVASAEQILAFLEAEQAHGEFVEYVTNVVPDRPPIVQKEVAPGMFTFERENEDEDAHWRAEAAYNRRTAAWALYRHASDAVKTLMEATKQHPEIFRSVAEQCASWPAFVSPLGDFVNANQELIETLNVGARVPGKGERWSLQTPANELAICLIRDIRKRQIIGREIENVHVDVLGQDTLSPEAAIEVLAKGTNYFGQYNLLKIQTEDFTRRWLEIEPPHPPVDYAGWRAVHGDALGELNQTNARKWFEAAWTLLHEATNGKPEKHPKLRPLGKGQENKGTARSGTKSSETNIQHGIKTVLKRSFIEVFGSLHEAEIK